MNVYSNAAVWLGFTSNVACAEGCNDSYEHPWYWIAVVASNAGIYACALMVSSKYEARGYAEVQPAPCGTVDDVINKELLIPLLIN